MRASATGEHHHQTVVLAGVMPGTPTDIERENPRHEPVRGVEHHSRDDHQQREMEREELVFFELLARVICAVDRGHEMRVIEDDGEEVKRYGPAMRVRWGEPCSDGQ